MCFSALFGPNLAGANQLEIWLNSIPIWQPRVLLKNGGQREKKSEGKQIQNVPVIVV